MVGKVYVMSSHPHPYTVTLWVVVKQDPGSELIIAPLLDKTIPPAPDAVCYPVLLSEQEEYYLNINAVRNIRFLALTKHSCIGKIDEERIAAIVRNWRETVFNKEDDNNVVQQ